MGGVTSRGEDEERAFRTYLKFWRRFLEGDAREWLRWLSWKEYPIALPEHSGAAVGYSPSRHGIWLRTDEENRRNITEHFGITKEDRLPVDLPSQFLPRGRLYGVMAHVVQVQLAVCRAGTVVGGALRHGSFPEALRATAGSDVPPVFLGFTVIPRHVKSSTPGVRWIRLIASDEEARRFSAAKATARGVAVPAMSLREIVKAQHSENSRTAEKETGSGGDAGGPRAVFPGPEGIVEKRPSPPETLVSRFRDLQTRDVTAGLVLKIVLAAHGSNLRSCPAELARLCYETWYDIGPHPGRRDEASSALNRLEQEGWVQRNSGDVYSRHLTFPEDVGWRVRVCLDQEVVNALLHELIVGYPDAWFLDGWFQWMALHAAELPRRIPRRVLASAIMAYLKHPDRQVSAVRALASIASTRAREIPSWARRLIDDGDTMGGLVLLRRYAERRRDVEPSVWCDILRASARAGAHDTALEAFRKLSEEVLASTTRDDERTLEFIGWSILDICSRSQEDDTIMASVLQTFGRTEPLESVARIGDVVRLYWSSEQIVRPHLRDGVSKRNDTDDDARSSLKAKPT